LPSFACPFVYSTGKRCSGRIVRIEAYKADITWEAVEDGAWQFFFSPRSHYHFFCSEKGSHSGSLRPDNPQMKFHWRELPDDIRNFLASVSPGDHPANASNPD
jgi:hypothetical protein